MKRVILLILIVAAAILSVAMVVTMVAVMWPYILGFAAFAIIALVVIATGEPNKPPPG